MRGLLFELGHAAGSIFRSPGFTATAGVILALGLGLTSYMFGAIDAYFLMPLPFKDPERIVHLELAGAGTARSSVEVSLHDFLEWRNVQKSFTGLAAFHLGTVNLSGDDQAERYNGAFVTANGFELLGIQALIGRGFAPGDDAPGAPRVVVLGFELWQRRYGADPGVLGRAVRVNSQPATIAGVMPRGFRFPLNEEIWVPLSLDVSRLRRGEGPSLEVFGRLGQRAGLAQAQAELRAITARLAERHPDTNKDLTAVVKPYAEEFLGGARPTIYAMFGAVWLVLLIACANVANLVLARNAARRRELAVRTALGASRWRVALLVLSECLAISAVGAVFGSMLATWAGDWTMETLRSQETMAPPYWVRFEHDWRTVLFIVSAACVAAAAAGLAPAFRASRTDVLESLRHGGHGVAASSFGRTSRVLLAAQVAFACAVLVCAGLTARSVVAVQTVALGADVKGVLTARVGLFEANYPKPADRVRFFEGLAERLQALPGVVSATVTTGLPGSAGGTFFAPEGHELPPTQQRPVAREVVATPEYLETLRIPLLEGRRFVREDREGAPPVAIVSRALADKYWPGQGALGKRLKLGRPKDDQPWRTVVGVAGNVALGRVDDQPLPAIYLPLQQVGPRFMSLAVRSQGEPLRLAEPVRKALRELDPDVPLYWLRTLEELVDAGRFPARFMATLFGSFALVGIALGAVGQYAVLAYAVAQRTREIGLRRALGAPDGEIRRMILRDGLRHLAIGLGAGLPLAFGLARLIANELVGVKPFDPATFGGVLLGLSAAVLLASLLPVRRALRVDPAVALRCD